MKLSQTGNNFRLGLAMDRAHDVSIISMLDEEKNRLPSSFNNIALLVVREFWVIDWVSQCSIEVSDD